MYTVFYYTTQAKANVIYISLIDLIVVIRDFPIHNIFLVIILYGCMAVLPVPYIKNERDTATKVAFLTR